MRLINLCFNISQISAHLEFYGTKNYVSYMFDEFYTYIYIYSTAESKYKKSREQFIIKR